jgi:ribosome biogenesis GTPase / thiamine phosphate phosphatase
MHSKIRRIDLIDLIKYGYSKEYEKDHPLGNHLIPARIAEIHRGDYRVVCKFGETSAVLKGSFFHTIQTSDSFPAVGDFVSMLYNSSGSSSIVGVLPRISKFSRTDFSGHAVGYVKTVLEQVIAANFDTVLILMSLNTDFNLNRMMRYVIVSRQSGATPVIVLTKADLCSNVDEEIRKVQAAASTIDIIAVSVLSGLGLDRLARYLEPAKTLVFLGSSGVGKSSLVNSLAKEEIMPVNAIRDRDDKGRHTTTHRQLIMLITGAMVIDTPGIRELGMWYVQDGLDQTYADIEKMILRCRFADCTHINEPGCAVLEGLRNGSLDRTRYENYLNLKCEAKFTKHKSEKPQRSIAKHAYQDLKNGGNDHDEA